MDAESSPAVRPGAPDMGRPSRNLDVQDRVSLSTVARDRASEPLTYKNPKDTSRAKVVDELAEKFFNPVAFVREEGEGPQSEEALKHMNEGGTLVARSGV